MHRVDLGGPCARGACAPPATYTPPAPSPSRRGCTSVSKPENGMPIRSQSPRWLGGPRDYGLGLFSSCLWTLRWILARPRRFGLPDAERPGVRLLVPFDRGERKIGTE